MLQTVNSETYYYILFRVSRKKGPDKFDIFGIVINDTRIRQAFTGFGPLLTELQVFFSRGTFDLCIQHVKCTLMLPISEP